VRHGVRHQHDAQALYRHILKAEGIKAEVIPWDLGTFKGQQADIIVAAMDMEMHLRSTTARVVLIRNLVDKAEIRTKVVAAIRELQGAAGSA